MTRNSSIRLSEVDVLKCILPVFIILYHSFAIYSGNWDAPVSSKGIIVYKWIADFSISFILEAFVGLSGYLFAKQNQERGIIGFSSLLKSKFRRLYVPSLVFSFLYVIALEGGDFSWAMMCSIFSGAGHMWFLPMLFWSFIVSWPLLNIQYLHNREHLVLCFCGILALLSPLAFFVYKIEVLNVLRIRETFYFLFFFWGGIVIWKYRTSLKRTSWKTIVGLWIAFLLVFVLGTCVRDRIEYTFEFIGLRRSVKYSLYLIYGGCQFLFSSCGTFVVFLTVLQMTDKKVSPFLQEVAGFSFGIYICQQFVLKFLYYHTTLPELVGPYFLPWVGFFVTVPLSFLVVRESKRI